MSESPTTYLNADAVVSLLSSDPEAHANGPTMISKLTACARRVRLSAEVPGDPLEPANEKRNVGTLVHKLTELHDVGEDPARFMARAVGHSQVDPLLEAAWYLYEKYAAEFPVGWWGTLLGAELHLARVGPMGLETGTLDRLWQVNVAAQERIETRFCIRLPGPGIYGWDLKTSSQKSSSLKEQYLYDPQPFRYLTLVTQPLTVTDLWGGNSHLDDVRGFIIFQAIRYKTDRQDRFQAACLDVRDVLSEANTARQQAWHARAITARKADEARSDACQLYGQLCSHFEAGRCPGY